MKRLVSYLILIGAAAAMGITAGFVGKKLFGPPELDDSGLEGALQVDAKAIVERIDSYNGDKDKVEAFSTSEILNYSLEKFRLCENCCSFTFGVADTIVKQDIRGCSIKNGETYFEESISKSSMVSLANRMLQEGKNSNVSLYSADKGSIEISDISPQAEYSNANLQEFTSEDYKSTYGKTLDEMFIYIVTEDTIINPVTEKKEDGYVIDVDLDPDLGTVKYKKQMLNVSDLDAKPKFEVVHLTFRLDKELRLKKLSVNEKYTARKVVDAKINGMLDIYYFSDMYVKIPEITEKIDYIKGE
ncbi:MAG: hypothetical protein K6E21_00365 [Bacilli bacterium]|nr:hypothetical protein [Bacilli bacterium]